MIVLRDIVLIVAVFYVRYKTLSPPRTLLRYFNPCYATAQLKPTFISKVHHSFYNSNIRIQLLSLWPKDRSGDKQQMKYCKKYNLMTVDYGDIACSLFGPWIKKLGFFWTDSHINKTMSLTIEL
uniref:Cardiolipin synthase 1 n=1 Tax=Sphenodon punctatus TaxID=8508 RepID=A0A8D0HQ87_SPHPU